MGLGLMAEVSGSTESQLLGKAIPIPSQSISEKIIFQQG